MFILIILLSDRIFSSAVSILQPQLMQIAEQKWVDCIEGSNIEIRQYNQSYYYYPIIQKVGLCSQAMQFEQVEGVYEYSFIFGQAITIDIAIYIDGQQYIVNVNSNTPSKSVVIKHYHQEQCEQSIDFILMQNTGQEQHFIQFYWELMNSYNQLSPPVSQGTLYVPQETLAKLNDFRILSFRQKWDMVNESLALTAIVRYDLSLLGYIYISINTSNIIQNESLRIMDDSHLSSNLVLKPYIVFPQLIYMYELNYTFGIFEAIAIQVNNTIQGNVAHVFQLDQSGSIINSQVVNHTQPILIYCNIQYDGSNNRSLYFTISALNHDSNCIQYDKYHMNNLMLQSSDSEWIQISNHTQIGCNLSIELFEDISTYVSSTLRLSISEIMIKQTSTYKLEFELINYTDFVYVDYRIDRGFPYAFVVTLSGYAVAGLIMLLGLYLIKPSPWNPIRDIDYQQ